MASLPQLQELFTRVYNSTYSSFYRNFYGPSVSVAPDTLLTWESLPLLTKADVIRTPYNERIFISPSEVDIVRMTSGTTSSGVLAIPRAKMPYTKAEASFMPVDCYMGFLLPHRVYDNYTKPGARFIGGDPARLAESAALAAHMGIEGIGALPSTLIAFAEPLSAVYDINRIRHLCFNGDVCTKLQHSALSKLYPSVKTMVSAYGSSETQGLCGVSIEYSGHENALLGHPSVHYEIVDSAGVAIAETPAEGELVVSILYEHAAFPLVRYKTGDTVLMLERSAERTVFAVQGRTASDRVRFSAGSILLPELERAISVVTKGMVADFEATVREERNAEKPLTSLSIILISPPLYADTISPDIARHIEEELRVSEHRTYAEAVRRGACTPITCSIEGLTYGFGRKRRRLTDARER